jgi:hypothetical protein
LLKIGPFRHPAASIGQFAATQQFGHFRSEVDVVPTSIGDFISVRSGM